MIEINLLIKSSLILGIAWAVLLVYKNAAPRFRFNIWKWSFIILLIVPFLNFQPIVTWAPTTKIAPATAIHSGSDLMVESHTTANTQKPKATSAPPIARQAKHYNWIRIIWISGTMLMLLILMLEFLTLSLLKKSTCKIPPRWQGILDQSKQKYGVKKPINLVFRKQVNDVFTYGFFHPVIVLPSIAKSWADEQIQAVLLHELAHIKRGDFSHNIVVQIVKAIYWFNPLAWKAADDIRLEAEQASDRLVLKSGMAPWDYAQQLVDSAKMLQAKPQYSKQLSFSMTGGKALKKRMHRILNPDTKSIPMSKKFGIFTTLALLSLLFSSLSVEPIHPGSLQHADPFVRMQAISALSRDFSQSTTKQLVPMLKDTHHLVRERTLLALGKIASSHTFYDIKASLSDPHPKVRAGAIYALFEISCLPAYREIAEARYDPDPLVSQKATEYLTKYNRQKLMKWLKKSLHEGSSKQWIINQFLAIEQAGSQEALLQLLAGQDLSKKQAIQKVIKHIEQPGAFQELRKLLF